MLEITHYKYLINPKNLLATSISTRGWEGHTVGLNFKNPLKIRFRKIVKLTGHTCVCNDLTNFECEAQATGNGSSEHFWETCMENLVNHLGWTKFLVGFHHLEPLWAIGYLSGPRRRGFVRPQLKWKFHGQVCFEEEQSFVLNLDVSWIFFCHGIRR